MGTSYMVLLTTFYVDNGPRLQLWDRLPVLAFWYVPSLIGLPLVLRAMVRSRGRLDTPPTRSIERPVAVWSVLDP
jgi:hypothetical protein